MDVEPFHVVDLVAEVGLEDRRAVHGRARHDRAQRNPPDADVHALEPGELTLQDQQLAAMHQSSVGNVVVLSAADRELPGRLAANQEADGVALGIEATLGQRDQRAGQRVRLRHHHQRFDALVVRQLAQRRGHRDRLATRVDAVAPEVEFDDLVDALEAHIGGPAVECERLAIVPLT